MEQAPIRTWKSGIWLSARLSERRRVSRPTSSRSKAERMSRIQHFVSGDLSGRVGRSRESCAGQGP
eukprot:scaffold9076_cov68-Phaeocystis_antarctica.AAC.9